MKNVSPFSISTLQDLYTNIKKTSFGQGSLFVNLSKNHGTPTFKMSTHLGTLGLIFLHFLNFNNNNNKILKNHVLAFVARPNLMFQHHVSFWNEYQTCDYN